MMARQEADSCLDLYHMAYAFPLVVRKNLHQNLQDYLRILVEKEWDTVAANGTGSPVTMVAFRNIWWTLIDYNPQSNKEQDCYQKCLDTLQQLSDGRRYRMQISGQGLPPVLWGVLIAGGMLTVIFTYLFEVENVKAQTIMTILVSLSLSLNILLVALFNNPYRGYLRISASSFSYDLRVTEELQAYRPDK